MVELVRKSSAPFIVKRHRWFADKPRPFFFYNTSYYWSNFKVPPLGYKKEILHTMIINLSDFTPENLINSFSQKCRSKIKKAIASGVTIEQEDSLENFVTFYNRFAAIRKIPTVDVSQLKEVSNNNLFITKAVYKNEEICFMLYMFDPQGKRVISWYTCSLIWLEHNPAVEKIIDWSNRFIYYDGMITFMKQGYKIFDLFGYGYYNGIKKDLKWEGISEFKRGFHGRVIEVYNFTPYIKIIFLSMFGKKAAYKS